ncbi:MAG: carboxy terminal-processing peptidase [Lentisphaerae bacterium]|nr:carboxy terminal-processing peptidase [Lentisphaerota bacterium]
MILFLLSITVTRVIATELTQADLTKSGPAVFISKKISDIHITDNLLDDNIITNAVHLFIKSLDYNKVFFLDDDINRFKENMPGMVENINRGDITFAADVFNTLIARISNRVDFINNVVDAGFDLNTNEKQKWDRQDADWAADHDEWDEIWRKRIQREYVTKLAYDALEKEKKAIAEKNTTETKEADHKTDKSDTPDLATEDDYVDPALLMSPEEFIKNKYRQLLIVMQDRDNDWIQETFLTAILQAFDPHSQYLSTSTLDNFEISMKLSLVGIGATLQSEDGAAKIVHIVPGGAADKDKRLKPGDKIFAVAQGDEPPVNILHMPLNKSVSLIRGKKGTKVVLYINPRSDPSSVRVIDIIRDEVKIEEQRLKSHVETVEKSDGTERKLGVVTIPSFYAEMNLSGNRNSKSVSSASDLKNELSKLNAENIDGLLLDLRDNSGGSLKEAVDMTGLFIKTGPVVQVKDRTRVSTLSDTDFSISYRGPIVVLINKQSASAAEILAAALQDYGLAVVVGDAKTHGKGTIQTIIDLERTNPGYGALKVTTAGFYRISGPSTQLDGVAADIVLPSFYDNLEIDEEHLQNVLVFEPLSPTRYRQLQELDSLIPDLEAKSIARRSKDQAFQEYEKLCADVAKRIKDDTISLNYDKYLKELRNRRELDNFGQNNDTKEPDDVVLNESLHILNDLIEVYPNHNSGFNLFLKKLMERLN